VNLMSVTCLIAYCSMSGNTEEMAETIGKGIRQAGADVEVKDVLMVDINDILNYDGVLLGAYTWGDGDLPDEFLDFYDEMDQLNLTGKKAAAFGSCDSSYEHFGGAVDKLVEKLTEIQADVVLEGLKVDLAPTEEDKEQCIQFGMEFVKKMEMGE
jgi:flavodoxin I